jgi:hypothetical protein
LECLRINKIQKQQEKNVPKGDTNIQIKSKLATAAENSKTIIEGAPIDLRVLSTGSAVTQSAETATIKNLATVIAANAGRAQETTKSREFSTQELTNIGAITTQNKVYNPSSTRDVAAS